MDHHREGQTSTAKRSLKRKLEREFEDQSENRKVLAVEPREAHRDLAGEVLAHVSVLESTSFSAAEADRASAKGAAVSLSELAKYGTVFGPTHASSRYDLSICIIRVCI